MTIKIKDKNGHRIILDEHKDGVRVAVLGTKGVGHWAVCDPKELKDAINNACGEPVGLKSENVEGLNI